MQNKQIKNVKGDSLTISKSNEDAFGYGEDCAWVLDGSTGLNGKRLVADEGGSDAQWYSKKFSAFLAANLSNSNQTLQEIFSEGVRSVWEEFAKLYGGAVDPADVPCAVGTAIRIRDGFMEYICVGDCSLLVRFKDGRVEEFLDYAHRTLDQGSIALSVHIAREKNIPISQTKAYILPRLRAVRMTMNTPGGYISLANNHDAVLQAKVGKIPVSEIQDVCMASDGFSAYYDPFALTASLAGFMDEVKNKSIQEMFDRLVAEQRADETFEKCPRFKLSDDATLIYFSL